MGKYMASPWGDISGKLGKSVGTKWKGINIVRAWVMPKNPKTIRQMNERMAVLGMLGHIAKENLLTFIRPIWEKICKKKKLAQTGYTLFIQANARRLYNSIPDKDKLVGEDNLPNYTKILFSMGKLEPTSQIGAVSYKSSSGELRLEWNPNTYQNGDRDDRVYIGVYQRGFNKEPFGKFEVFESIVKRSAGEVSVWFRKGVEADEIYVYVFFHNKDIGYSPSKGKKVGR